MKKEGLILLALVLVFGFVVLGCGSTSEIPIPGKPPLPKVEVTFGDTPPAIPVAGVGGVVPTYIDGGYKITYDESGSGAQYGTAFGIFELPIAEGVSVADYSKITLTYQAVDGDVGNKRVVLLASFSTFADAGSNPANDPPDTAADVFVIGERSANIDDKDKHELTFTFTAANKAAFKDDAEKVFFSVYIHAGKAGPTAFEVTKFAIEP